MRALPLFLVLAACGGAAADGVPGSPVDAHGSGPARSYPATGFTAVDLAAVDDVAITTGGAFAVRAEGDPATLDKLRITRDGDTLHVGRVGGLATGNGSAKVFVTMPRIAEAAVSGTGDLTVDKVAGQGFAADVSGTGSIRVNAAQLGKAAVSISGSGDVVLAGTAQMLTVQLSGTGELDARLLKAAGAEVDASGTGDVRAAVNGPAKVSASGTGDVDLGPGARCQTSKTGTGDVTCGG